MPHHKYAILMGDQQHSYFFVKKLGVGGGGMAYLVRDPESGRLLVWKKTFAQIDGDNDRFCANDVRFYREHPLIPEILNSRSIYPLTEDSPDHDSFKFGIIVQKFCNGGDLEDFRKTFLKMYEEVPEPLIWQFARQMLEVLRFLHKKITPAVSHTDIHASNIFVHWPLTQPEKWDGKRWKADKSKAPYRAPFPDFHLGDFGYAEEIDERDSHSRQFKYQDLEGFISCLAFLIFRVESLSDLTDKWDARMYEAEQAYSMKLIQFFIKLEEFHRTPETRRGKFDIVHFRDEAKDALVPLKCNPQNNFLDGRPHVDNKPLMFESAQELAEYDDLPVGPWRIVKVDANTLDIIKVRSRWYKVYEPQDGFPYRYKPCLKDDEDPF